MNTDTEEIKKLYDKCIADGLLLFENIDTKEVFSKYPKVAICHVVDSEMMNAWGVKVNEMLSLLRIPKFPPLNNSLISAIFIFEFLKGFQQDENYSWLSQSAARGE